MVLRPLRVSGVLHADRVLSARAEEEGGSRLGSRGAWLILGGIVLVGLLLRLDRFVQPFNGDELSTLYLVDGNSLGGTLSDISSDKEISPPLFFLLSWAMTKLGSAPELVRLPSLIAGVASIPLVYVLGMRTVGRTAALLGAAVMALSPFMIFYSGDGRTYALAIALLLGSTIAMLAAARTGRTRWWVAYAVLTALAMYTHYTAAFVLAAQLLWLLWAHPEARRAAILANLGAIVLFAPWIPSTLADFDSPTIEILDALQGDGFEVKRAAVESWAFGYPYLSPSEFPGVFTLLLLGIALLVAAIAALVRWFRSDPDRTAWLPEPSKGAVLVFAIALATPVAEALLLILFGNDLFSSRNLNTSSGGLALSIGTVLAAAGPLVGTVCAVAVLAGFSIGAVKTLGEEAQPVRFDDAAEFVEQEAEPGDVVVDMVSAALTPVPLTPLAVYLDEPPPQTPLYLPTGEPPFLPYKSPPLPANEEFRKAFRAAEGHRVFLVSSEIALSEAEPGEAGAVTSLIADPVEVTLPAGARVLEQVSFEGKAPINVYVIDPGAGAKRRSG